MERALAKLPEEQRSVVLLVGVEGMGYEEAAAVLNVPVGTVRSRVSRGRESLRKMTGLFPHSAFPASRHGGGSGLLFGPRAGFSDGNAGGCGSALNQHVEDQRTSTGRNPDHHLVQRCRLAERS